MVLFYPELETCKNVMRVLGEVNHVFLVDNTDSFICSSWLLGLGQREDITLIRNNANRGIAGALNIGLKQAVLLGYKFSLLMDQDSKFYRGALFKLLSIYDVASKDSKICIVGSAHQKKEVQGCKYVIAKTVISSGTLLNLKAYCNLGDFREDYFIDQVDHEYCLRAVDNGYLNLVSSEKLMDHFIGQESFHFIWKFKVKVTNHSALRRYYFARNKVFLLRDYLNSHPVYVGTGLLNIMKIALLIFLFETEKKEKLLNIFLGIRDGVFNVSGKRV